MAQNALNDLLRQTMFDLEARQRQQNALSRLQPENTIRVDATGEYLRPGGGRTMNAQEAIWGRPDIQSEFDYQNPMISGESRAYRSRTNPNLLQVSSRGMTSYVDTTPRMSMEEMAQRQKLRSGELDIKTKEKELAEGKPVQWNTVQTEEGFAQINPFTGEVRKLGITPIGKTGAGTAQQRQQDAQDAMMILQQAAPLVDQSTQSGIGNIADIGAGFLGMSTKGAEAADQLKVLGGALVSKMPKMTGPQSDKDVQLYKEMAGRLGDPTVPAERKKAAMRTIMDLQAKYAGTQPAELQFGQESKPTSVAQNTVTAPDGSVFRFPTAQQADAFKRAHGL